VTALTAQTVVCLTILAVAAVVVAWDARRRRRPHRTPNAYRRGTVQPIPRRSLDELAAEPDTSPETQRDGKEPE
jgi:hypothetical protein